MLTSLQRLWKYTLTTKIVIFFSDTKGFSCSLCDLSFRRKDNMLRHVRTSHPGKSAIPVKKCVRSELLKLKKKTKSLSEQQPLVDNPNAINVITVSPACILKPEAPTITKPVSVINAPLKLAFKTPAFKNHYNIHRLDKLGFVFYE